LKNKLQIMAPRITPLAGVSTYALRGIGVRGVEKPQGFGIDERRLIKSDEETRILNRNLIPGHHIFI
jgi:hypothetical protein